jgi:subtilisin-like proprotein convertase family protein
MKRITHASSAQRFPRLTICVVCALFINGLAAGQDWRSDHGHASQLAPESIINTFTNPGSITIPNVGAGTPYPSTINVSNVPMQLAKVTVRLNNLSHTFPNDIDILLVGPQGQTAMIMSDVGSGDDVNGITLTLDDAAAIAMPNAILSTGTYKPTNLGTPDPFPAPAPASNGSAALTVFQGTNPNGEWKLFLVDDAGADVGTLAGGWTLTLTAAISGQNTNAITIPDTGIADPYPSDITISNHNDTVSRVLVTLANFSHASPDDVDIMLVSPSGRAVVLMSDVGGSNAVTNLNISIDDTGTSDLPDSGALTSGTFRPANYEPGDTFPAPAPSGIPMGRTLSSLNGTVANGVWRLFVVDDSGASVGNISGGWNILVGTSAGAINIVGTGTADPYPSQIVVSGYSGSITRATVTLSNFSHLSPDDVDIMVVGPDGRRIVLMSDAGGTTEAGGIDLTFDDNAASAIPDSGALASGTYRPADYEPGEVFPAPAPSGAPTGSTLNAFYGGVPNGIWRLYILNENGTSFGSIAGTWSVTLQASTSACLHSLSPAVQGFPVSGGNGSFNVTQPTGCSWTASTQDPFITVTSPATGGGNGSVSFTVAANQGPARTGFIDVTNGVSTRSFQIQQPSGCPLSAAQSAVNFTAAGGTGSVNISAGSVCSWQGTASASWVQITSQPQSGNGTLTFAVQPNTSLTSRSATITVGAITITVNQAPLRTVPFDFDGDLRSDISVFRPSSSTWWIALSASSALSKQFGIPTDRIAPADYDGDRKADIAVYRDGTWYLLRSLDGTVSIISWGTAEDVPVPGDYNGDASAEPAVFRPSTGTWWTLNPNGSHSSIAFGISTDAPVPADYDGDGKMDLAVYRGAIGAGGAGIYWILNSSNGSAVSHAFGIQGDIPVPADYDGDGRDNVAVYRPSTGYWYRSLDPATNYGGVQWGVATDRPAPADYDGDGKAEPAVFRNGVWYILGTSSGTQIVQFGVEGDKAVPSAFVP